MIGPRRGGVAVRDLFKSYGRVAAVSGVSLSVAPGEIVGLLGPNGAGKTTTVESIIGLTRPDSGAIEVCGLDARAHPADAKRRLGVVLQSTGLPDGVTPREALNAFAALYGVDPRTEPLLDRYGLGEKADVRVARLSGGQRQRLAIALAFVGDPDVMILDEPTVGLDPLVRRELHEQVLEMKAEGRAVLLTTHDLDEAAQLCDRVVVIDRGKVVAEGAPAELVAEIGQAIAVDVRTDRPVEPGRLAALAGVAGLAADERGLKFTTSDLAAVLPVVSEVVLAQGAAIVSLQASRGNLEDVIRRLTERRP